jgi:hypothetical protein
MDIKVTAISAGILVALSSVASAQTPPPPTVPSIYNSGPAAPLLNTTNLSAAERSAYSLYEGVLQITEAAIHATSCKPASYSVDVYADGSLNNPSLNEVTISSNGATEFALTASVASPVTGRGQQVAVGLVGTQGFLGSTKITSFTSTFAYNNVNNMLVSNNTTIGIVGINGGLPDLYSGVVIKDFYRGDNIDSTNPQYYNIYDWGLQAISKLNYPVNKWWQRSLSHRDDGTIARTVFVKDRLVGASSCRIILDTTGYNNQNYFWQGSSIGTGTLTITTDAPAALVEPDATGAEAWAQYPFQ